jgi:hypothetical protein
MLTNVGLAHDHFGESALEALTLNCDEFFGSFDKHMGLVIHLINVAVILQRETSKDEVVATGGERTRCGSSNAASTSSCWRDASESQNRGLI